MISDLSSKLMQVIEQIPKDMLYDFLCSYAQSAGCCRNSPICDDTDLC